jgi:hypothetical protein
MSWHIGRSVDRVRAAAAAVGARVLPRSRTLASDRPDRGGLLASLAYSMILFVAFGASARRRHATRSAICSRARLRRRPRGDHRPLTIAVHDRRSNRTGRLVNTYLDGTPSADGRSRFLVFGLVIVLASGPDGRAVLPADRERRPNTRPSRRATDGR